MSQSNTMTLEKALPAIRKLKQRADELEARQHEPIAILSMACRLPGGIDGPEALWEAFVEERDMVGPFPPRWAGLELFDPDPEAVGRSYAREGGFIDDIESFDASFFGISPREALSMDPQQRLLLQTSWEALERAGIVPSTLGESLTGVYIGAMDSDYAVDWRYALSTLDGYHGTGAAGSVLSGRISYTLGLQGPSLTVDTACSSSLVALHLASVALRRRECEMALVGGVTVMSTPTMFVEFSRLKGLAPDGRCKSFSAGADGAGWSEGCAVVVLKRLSDAQRDGDRVLAVLRGSAINQDGRSHGMTAPNGPSQVRVIRAALADARLDAEAVDAVEAHGTGTSLGDPIEAGALRQAYGKGRAPDRALHLGSSKSNLGHCQAAAGLVGVMKMVLALEHERLPRTLHCEEPSPHVEWEGSGLRLLQRAKAWPRAAQPRRAGISSFGISGTNAHVILEEAPPAESVEPSSPARVGEISSLLLAGEDDAAIVRQAQRLSAWLRQHPEASLRDVVHTLRLHRAHPVARAVLTTRGHAQTLEALDALAAQREHPWVAQRRAQRRKGITFVFPGQGGQWPGMGAALLDESVAFRETLEACDEVLRLGSGWSLLELLRDPQGESCPPLGRADVVQPALFAIYLGLAAVWRSLGVEPAAVVGHSQGEVAAAVVAGALTLADGARVVAARSGAVAGTRARGGMVLIGRPVDEVEAMLASYGNALSVAVVNTASSTVVSGDADALDALLAELEQQDLFCRRVDVDYASHCAHMDPLLEGLRAELAPVVPRETTIPFYSTVTGGVVQGSELGADYWCRNLRQTVRFDRALTALMTDGHGVFVECSPHPVLIAPIVGAEDQLIVTGTLRRDHGDLQQIIHSFGDLHAQGHPVPAKTLLTGGEGRFLPTLPTYAFEPRRFWLAPQERRVDAESMGLRASEHPWLGVGTPLAADGGMMMSGRLSPERDAWLREHRVFGRALFPGTGMLELALAAAGEVGCRALEELAIAEPMRLGDEPRILQVSLSAPAGEGRRELSIHSRASSEDEWQRHATGRTAPETAALGVQWMGDEAWPRPGTTQVDLEGLYVRLAAQGLDYGPSFRGLLEVWRPVGSGSTETLYARVVLPPGAGEPGCYGVHPALLDAAMHALLLGVADRLAPGEVLLPFAWSDVTLHASGSDEIRVEIGWQALEADHAAVSLRVVDPTGQPVLEVGCLELRRADARSLYEALGRHVAHLLEVRLHERPHIEDIGPSLAGTVVLGEAGGLAARLGLEALGEPEAALERIVTGELRASRILVDAAALRGEGEDPLEVAERALRLQQRFLGEPSLDEVEWVWVTCEALAGGGGVHALASSMLWGLARVARTEHPERAIRLIDVEESSSHALLVAALSSSAADEPERVLRGDRIWVPSLARATVPAADGVRPLDPQGTVLITGGTGELGRSIAHHLVAHHGVRHLLLLSRRGDQAPGVAELVAQLEGAGARTVTVAACNVAERESLARALAGVAPEHPLTAVFHLAGLLDDGLLTGQTPQRLRSVLAPKVLGSVHLHELTASADLNAFVLFSSLAGIVGAAGQSTYAAANTFLDALATSRRALGRPGLSLAWGLWVQEGVGMTAGLGRAELARMRQQGVVPLSVDEGLAAFDAALRSTAATLVPAKLELGPLQARLDRGEGVPQMLRGLLRTRLRTARAEEDGASLRSRLAGLSALAQERVLVELVRAQVAEVLGLSDASDIMPTQILKALGLDSLMAVELRNRLARVVEHKLPATLAFDHPTPQDIARLLLEKLSLGAQTKLRVELSSPAPRAASDERIAIVSMACRIPGGIDTPEAFWDALDAGVDLVGPMPERWRGLELYDPDPEAAGKSYAREGGFIDGVEGFDAGLFGISPREAESMDPQQRVVLEVAWEALERAGLSSERAGEASTGVYLGTMSSDYALARRQDLAGLDGYQSTGNASSVLSGRVSYVFGLRGPAITVDTACSSSLVALHLASAALRSGECDIALAGGVTVMSSPAIFVEFSRLRGMAPDGRCKSFSADADGAGWSEACGVVVLKRYADAQRDGDRILAVVRGSAVNQDGRSQGLTAPNGPSQQRVIREALRRSGLEPVDIDAVEAHGTGTSLGDPIEAGALQAVFGSDRGSASPVWLGSSKSNLGHAQAAAGIVGVLKMVLALEHERLPRTLHVEHPTTAIDWQDSGLALLRDARPWPRGERRRRAGISSFGISGTNAHLILEDAPDPDPDPGALARGGAAPSWVPLVLSGADPDALRAVAWRWADWLEARPSLPLASVAVDASHRTSLAQRAVIVARDPMEAAAAARMLAQGRPHAHGIVGTGMPGDLAVLFSGQGSQRLGMGLQLREELSGFRSCFDEICEALDVALDEPLVSVIGARPGTAEAELLRRTEYTQPALFALEVALFRQWEALGVRPRFVVGHSVGEVAAAHVAGVLDLADAARLVCARGRLMQACRSGGSMASIDADEAEVLEAFAEVDPARVAIAGLNTPQQTVISGDAEVVRAVMDGFVARGRRVRLLDVSHAFHSAHMDAMQDELRAVAQQCHYRPAALELVSTVSGEAGDVMGSAEYWVEQARRPVRYMDAVRTLHALGVRRFLECGPHGVLCAMGAVSVPSGRFISSLDKEPDEVRAFVRAAGALHIAGEALDLHAMLGSIAPSPTRLPTYPFQRQRYWQASPPRTDVDAVGLGRGKHPWLGAITELADGTGVVLSGRLSSSSPAWVADHVVHGVVLMPGTGILELGLAAAAHWGMRTVTELTMAEPLVLDEPRQVQLTVSAIDADGRRAFVVYTRPAAPAEGGWTLHATGSLTDVVTPSLAPSLLELEQWPPQGEAIALAPMRSRLETQGLHYGPAFLGLDSLWVEPGAHRRVAFGHVGLPEGLLADEAGVGIHPALLDAALHTLMALMPDGPLLLPFAWSDVVLYATGAHELRVKAELHEPTVGAGAIASVWIGDGEGRPVLEIGALHLQPVTAEQLRSARSRRADGLYELTFVDSSPTVSTVDAGAGALVIGPAGSIVAKALGVEAHAWPDVVTRLTRASSPLGRVVIDATGPTPDSDPYPRIVASCIETLERLKAWCADESLVDHELIFVTRRAIAARRDEVALDPVGGALWGLVRSARNEHPGRRIRLIDLGDDDLASILKRALTLREGASAEPPPELVIRGEALLVPRLVRGTAIPMQDDVGLDPRGTVLVTGGTGALGRALVRHLVGTHGIRSLLVTSRRGAQAEGAEALCAELAGFDEVRVRVVACDVAQREGLERVLAMIEPEHPLCAVFHLAGVLDDGLLAEQTAARLERVLAPKILGALHLDALVSDPRVPLVLFSSLAGCMGGAGQSNYAAANAWLDGLASRRRGRGLAGVSLAWGLWEPNGEGMTAHLGVADLARLRRQGIAAMTTARALALLDRALLLSASHLVLADFALASLGGDRAMHPLLRGLVRDHAPSAIAAVTGATHAWPARVSALAPADRLELLVTLVRDEVGAVLGMGAGSSPPADGTLSELGLDSMMAVELRNRLASASGVSLPPTLAFDYPTPRAIAGLLHAAMASSSGTPVATLERSMGRVQLDAMADMLRRVPAETLEQAGLVPRLRELHDALMAAHGGIVDATTDLAVTSTEDLLTFLDGKLGTSR